MKTWLRPVARVIAIALLLPGCSTILGITYLSSDAGEPDASAGPDTSSLDAGKADADGAVTDGTVTDAKTDGDAAAQGDGDSGDAGQACSIGDAGGACTCAASICAEVGTVCKDTQTVATCRLDGNGCLFADPTTQTCGAPQSCSGVAPNAMCALTCTDSCTSGESVCESGQIASCTLGSNGCLAYGPPGNCPGSRQTCTGAAGAGRCTCIADPVCSAVGNTCSSSAAYVNCAQDPQGCFYQTSQTDCMGGATCTGGACGCGGATPNACAAVCTNLASDPENCGSCGTACPGAAHGETCAMSHCQPFTIATASSPFALTTDGVNVYYLANSASPELASVPVGGGTVSGPVSVPGAMTIATDGTDVYWGGSGDGGYVSLAPVTNIANASAVAGFADPTEVLFVDGAVNELFFAVQCDGILAVPLRTPNTSPGGGFGTGTSGCVRNSLVGDQNFLYFANPSAAGSGLLGLFRSANTGGALTSLSSATNIQGLALQAPYLYYTDAAGQTVSRVPADGSLGPVALTTTSNPGPLVADATNVYWIDSGGATIMKIPGGGGSATPIATGQSAVAIAQDSSSIYWANAGAIVRYPK